VEVRQPQEEAKAATAAGNGNEASQQAGKQVRQQMENHTHTHSHSQLKGFGWVERTKTANVPLCHSTTVPQPPLSALRQMVSRLASFHFN